MIVDWKEDWFEAAVFCGGVAFFAEVFCLDFLSFITSDKWGFSENPWIVFLVWLVSFLVVVSYTLGKFPRLEKKINSFLLAIPKKIEFLDFNE